MNEVTIVIRSADQSGAGVTSAEARQRKLTVTVGGTAEAYRTAEKAATGFGGTLRRVGEVAAGVLVADMAQRMAQRAKAFISQSVKAASDLGESVNAVNKVFGASTEAVVSWGKANANAIGLSQRAFNQAATPLGSMLKNQGLQMEQVEAHTIRLTERAADMASVFNTDVMGALVAIQAGLRGEIDPLERYGVSLSAVAVEAKALAETGKTAAKELTSQEKALARLNLIYEQTADTAGDFRDTSDGLANSQRIAAAAMEEAQAKIGGVFTPVMAKAAQISAGFATTVAGLPQPLVLVSAAVLGLAAATALLAPRIVATRSALDTMATSDSRLQRGVSKSAVAVGKAGAALTGLAIAGQIVGSVIGKDLNPQIEALNQGLGQWARTGHLGGEAARIFGADADELSKSLSSVAGSGFSQWMDSVTEKIPGFNATILEGRDQVRLFDEGLAGMVKSGQAEEAGELIERMAAQTKVSAGDIISVLPAYSAAMETGATKTTKLATAAQEAATSIDELDKQQSEYLNEAAFGLEEAQDAVAEATQRLKDQLKDQRDEHVKGAGSLTGNTQAARDNRDMVRDLTRKYSDLIIETAKTGASTTDLQKQLEDELVKMGFARTEAHNYAKELATLRGEIDQIKSKEVTVRVRVEQSRGFGAGNLEFAHGGITGAASGGPRGGRALLGEHGREIVDLPYGSRVHPNGTTEAMLAAGSSGTVRLEVGGRPSGPLEAMFTEWMIDTLARAVAGKGGGGHVLGISRV